MMADRQSRRARWRALLAALALLVGAVSAPLASFGKPTAGSDPRQIQFGPRVMF